MFAALGMPAAAWITIPGGGDSTAVSAQETFLNSSRDLRKFRFSDGKSEEATVGLEQKNKRPIDRKSVV